MSPYFFTLIYSVNNTKYATKQWFYWHYDNMFKTFTVIMLDILWYTGMIYYIVYNESSLAIMSAVWISLLDHLLATNSFTIFLIFTFYYLYLFYHCLSLSLESYITSYTEYFNQQNFSQQFIILYPSLIVHITLKSRKTSFTGIHFGIVCWEIIVRVHFLVHSIYC